jgi:hypothetical protein
MLPLDGTAYTPRPMTFSRAARIRLNREQKKSQHVYTLQRPPNARAVAKMIYLFRRPRRGGKDADPPEAVKLIYERLAKRIGARDAGVGTPCRAHLLRANARLSTFRHTCRDFLGNAILGEFAARGRKLHNCDKFLIRSDRSWSSERPHASYLR